MFRQQRNFCIDLLLMGLSTNHSSTSARLVDRLWPRASWYDF